MPFQVPTRFSFTRKPGEPVCQSAMEKDYPKACKTATFLADIFIPPPHEVLPVLGSSVKAPLSTGIRKILLPRATADWALDGIAWRTLSSSPKLLEELPRVLKTGPVDPIVGRIAETVKQRSIPIDVEELQAALKTARHIAGELKRRHIGWRQIKGTEVQSVLKRLAFLFHDATAKLQTYLGPLDLDAPWVGEAQPFNNFAQSLYKILEKNLEFIRGHASPSEALGHWLKTFLG